LPCDRLKLGKSAKAPKNIFLVLSSWSRYFYLSKLFTNLSLYWFLV